MQSLGAIVSRTQGHKLAAGIHRTAISSIQMHPCLTRQIAKHTGGHVRRG